MKEYLTKNEIESLIDMLTSSDEEANLLGINMLLSKSFRTTPSLRTAIYWAQVFTNREKKKKTRLWFGINGVHYISSIIIALKRELNKIERYDS